MRSPPDPAGRTPPAWLVALVLIVTAASVGRWWMEGRPQRLWRSDAVLHDREYCPDGMDTQIERLAAVLRGQEGAGAAFLDWIQVKNAHQSSTLLVAVLGAPLVVLGVPAAWAFVVWSTVASLLIVVLLWRTLREAFPQAPSLATYGVALFLVHPATLRCFSRPQTDALLALFALCAVVVTRRLVQTSRGTWWVVLLQTLALFVKIHALSLLLLAPATAFLAGARGRVLVRAFLAGTVAPLLIWATVFGSLDLFPTIQAAWDYKGQFYQQVTLPVVAQVLAMCLLPLLAVAAWRPRWRGLDASMWLAVGGFLAILWISDIPPKARFQYPLLAPLVFLTVASLSAGRGGRAPRVLLVSWFTLLSASILALDLYGRYLGPTHDLSPLDAIMIHLW